MARPPEGMMHDAPELYVTNFNPRFTGVSATVAAVLPQQLDRFRTVLVGHALPGCPTPISWRQALSLSRRAPRDRPFAIWHVRRNSEMQIALLARDILHLPIRIVFTSAAQRRHSAFPRWLIGRMDAVIATSEAAAKFVPGCRAVVPHGVDTNRFSPAKDRASAWRDTGFPGDYGIVTVGRIRPEKGTDLFVKAMLRALPMLPGAVAVVVGIAKSGDAAYLADLKAEVAAAGMADRLIFAGQVPPEQMPGLLQGARLLMALPRYEGFGVTPIEAMACAVPFIASQTGHFLEFAGPADDPKQAGHVVALEDWAAAADAAVSLLNDAPRYGVMARAARDRAVDQFGVSREAAAIEAIYREVWADGRA